MKKLFLGIAVVLALGIMASVAVAGEDIRGNDLPKAKAAYKLNIIAVGNPDHEVGVSSGRRMFVKLDGTTDIIMTQDDEGDFAVVDPNGLDGEATFNIGDTDPTDRKTSYLVFLRLLGKPNGSVRIEPQATYDDPTDPGVQYVFLGEATIFRRKAGPPKAIDISKFFYVDIQVWNGVEWVTVRREWVFNMAGAEYLWKYENNYDGNGGLRLAQVWFFEGALDINAAPPGSNTSATAWGSIKSR